MFIQGSGVNNLSPDRQYPEVIVISSDSEDETEAVPDSLKPTQELAERGSSDAIAAVYDEVVASVYNVLPEAEGNIVMKLADEVFGSCISKNEVVAKICDKLLQGLTNTSDVIVPNLTPKRKKTTGLIKRKNVPSVQNATFFPSVVPTSNQNPSQNGSIPVFESTVGDFYSTINGNAIPQTDSTFTSANDRVFPTVQNTDFTYQSEGKLQSQSRGALLEQNTHVKRSEDILNVPLFHKTNNGKKVYVVEVPTHPQRMAFQVGGLNEMNQEHLPKSAQIVRESVVDMPIAQTVNGRMAVPVIDSEDILHFNSAIGKIPYKIGEQKLANETNRSAELKTLASARPVIPTVLFNMFYENTLPGQVPVKLLHNQDKSTENNLPHRGFLHKKVEPTSTIVRPEPETSVTVGEVPRLELVVEPTPTLVRPKPEASATGIPIVREVPRLELAEGLLPVCGAQQGAITQVTDIQKSVNNNNNAPTLKRQLTRNLLSSIVTCTSAKKIFLNSTDSVSVKGNDFQDSYSEKDESHSMEKTNGNIFPSEDVGIDDVEYECNCCYNTVPFDDMVQCGEGHLFCCECLRRYTQEAVYGGGKASLMCMSDGCTATFPPSQLHRALPTELYNKYEERVEEEFISLANLEDFVRCPYCNVGAELVNTQQIFNCPNALCQKRVCRLCKADWVDHEGLKCDQVEKKDETKIRLAFEEKMAQAKIRQCSHCNAKYTKEDGCNKIYCRCGVTMCYICRAPKIDYSHFCNQQNHGKRFIGKCDKCKLCCLWSKGEEDDDMAIQEIKNDAQAERVTQGFTDEKEIGAPTTGYKKPVVKPKKPTPKRRRQRRNT